MNARSEILTKVINATGDHSASRNAEYAAIQRDYIRTGHTNREDVLALLAKRLHDYDAGVYRCGSGKIAETIAEAMSARRKATLLRPESVPAEWLPGSHRFQLLSGLSYHEIDQSEGVVTGCVTAIALTGTIILRHSSQEGRRAVTLIPDYHLCVVLADQVVETVAEGFERLKGIETSPLTTISGPSATADIEMNRVKGVHGPRFLDVILVS